MNAHLGSEVVGLHGGVVLAVSRHVATADLLDGHVLDVEADVVSGRGLGQRLVVHLHRLHLSGHVGGGEGNDHAGLQDAGLHAAHGHCSDTWLGGGGGGEGARLGHAQIHFGSCLV